MDETAFRDGEDHTRPQRGGMLGHLSTSADPFEHLAHIIVHLRQDTDQVLAPGKHRTHKSQSVISEQLIIMKYDRIHEWILISDIRIRILI